MNYDVPRLRRALAAEYALGTLRGRARARFERLLHSHSELRQELNFWEVRFASLLRGILPIQPRREIWLQIERHIRGEHSIATIVAAPAANEADEPAAAPARPSRHLWQIWAGLATAASIVLAVVLVTQSRAPAPAPVASSAAVSYVAQVTMPNSSMQWTFSLTPAHGRMSASTQGEVPASLQGHSAELWWLSAAGPVAIGVLPTRGGGTMPLPAHIDAGPITLAVSIEPIGGSPTGQPTGPVVASVVAVQVA